MHLLSRHQTEVQDSLLSTATHMVQRIKEICNTKNKNKDIFSDREIPTNRSSDQSNSDSKKLLQKLASRVDTIESDFADDNIPERHLYLLRDLRLRVVEIEKKLTQELEEQRDRWLSERNTLIRTTQDSIDEVLSSYLALRKVP